MNQVFENFKGLYTAADKYSTPGSPETANCDIDLNNNIIKSAGYTRVTGSTVAVTSMIASVNTVMVTANTIPASGTVIAYDVQLASAALVVEGTAWQVITRANSSIVLGSAITTGMTFTPGTANLDLSTQYLKGFATSAGGVDLTDIECQGAYYDSDADLVYAFLSNGTNSYLCYTDKDAVEWRFSEGSAVGSCTAFGITNNAWFDRYGSNIIFTKGETRGNEGSITSSGGLFTLNASGQIVLYGQANNPTAKVLAVHKERIIVGNVTAVSGVAQNGESWVMMSKLLPEKTDTTYVSSGAFEFGTGTAKVYTGTSVPAVGDQIYFSGVVVSGQNDLNTTLFTVIGTSGASAYLFEYNNVNNIAASGGTAVLRSPTWSPASVIYDDASVGAGIFKCDDNDTDQVIKLESAFGALSILRQVNPYIFTGAIESGDQTLARPLNVKYGTYSPHTYMTAGGVWFISQYGLSKLEGTTIKTNKNELDNIVDITYIEPIKPDFDNISNKNKLILHGSNRYLYMHDGDSGNTYVLDTLKSNWFKWTGRLADRFLNIGTETYAVYKHLLFKLNDEYRIWNLGDYDYRNMVSNYFTAVSDQDSTLNTKIYEMLYALIEGSATTATTNPLTFNIYYNGSRTAGYSFTFDIKTGALVTWDDVSSGATVTWASVSTGTWDDVGGVLISMLEKRKYRLGSGRTIQVEITHSDNSNFKISRFQLGYDLLDVDLKQ